jgi:hypothetical protein
MAQKWRPAIGKMSSNQEPKINVSSTYIASTLHKILSSALHAGICQASTRTDPSLTRTHTFLPIFFSLPPPQNPLTQPQPRAYPLSRTPQRLCPPCTRCAEPFHPQRMARMAYSVAYIAFYKQRAWGPDAFVQRGVATLGEDKALVGAHLLCDSPFLV